jgi:hypothetical protein
MSKMAKLFKNGRSQAVRLPLSRAISPSVPSVPASDTPNGLNLVRKLSYTCALAAHLSVPFTLDPPARLAI